MGFDKVYDLAGGMKAWQGVKAVGPKELNLELLRGDETPDEIVLLAYAMEKGLQHFYRDMSESREDPELRKLFADLVDIEEKHKQMIVQLQAEVGSKHRSPESFENDADSAVLEGGFDMQKLMDRNKPLLKTVGQVIGLAMMLETQALDLYLRFSEKSADEKVKAVLFKIADEEKGHLSALGGLMEEKL